MIAVVGKLAVLEFTAVVTAKICDVSLEAVEQLTIKLLELLKDFMFGFETEHEQFAREIVYKGE